MFNKRGGCKLYMIAIFKRQENWNYMLIFFLTYFVFWMLTEYFLNQGYNCTWYDGFENANCFWWTFFLNKLFPLRSVIGNKISHRKKRTFIKIAKFK